MPRSRIFSPHVPALFTMQQSYNDWRPEFTLTNMSPNGERTILCLGYAFLVQGMNILPELTRNSFSHNPLVNFSSGQNLSC